MPSSFMSSLRALARMTNRDLSPEAFELFEALVLEPHGETVAMGALTQYTRSSARGFPMPGELLEIIDGPAITPKQIANETAARMLGLISRRGHTWTDTFRYDGHETFEDAVRAEIGEEAIGVLNMCGGWQRFCRQFDEGENGNARPQLRDLLEAQIIRGIRANARLSLNPPPPKGHDAITEFVAKQKALNAKPATSANRIETLDEEKVPL